MMILIMLVSHTRAAMAAVVMAAFSSGKIRDFEVRLKEDRASRAEIVRRYNKEYRQLWVGGVSG
ncbi:hypothetical protein [Sphingobium aromaticiconvertens]|uniref:hypothetical protein n=1 Tax=Sphingobium aromaticiconvertens TaxID=365341 RepID=UPI003019D9A0